MKRDILDDFCLFILSHGRPDRVKSYNTARKSGYTGKIFIVVDNEDASLSKYYENYGDAVVVFNKPFIAEEIDTMDNFNYRKACVYARNACFHLAKELGYKYFCQWDDDYNQLEYKTAFGSVWNSKLDDVFRIFLEYYIENKNITCLALAQGGDNIGGFKEYRKVKRKAMNSLICSTERPINSIGTQNDDATDYILYGSRGDIYMSIMNIQILQEATQKGSSGMTDIYTSGGTYVKTFYSILACPSCVKVHLMGDKHKRLHHRVSWNNAVPCIISDEFKK